MTTVRLAGSLHFPNSSNGFQHLSQFRPEEERPLELKLPASPAAAAAERVVALSVLSRLGIVAGVSMAALAVIEVVTAEAENIVDLSSRVLVANGTLENGTSTVSTDMDNPNGIPDASTRDMVIGGLGVVIIVLCGFATLKQVCNKSSDRAIRFGSVPTELREL